MIWGNLDVTHLCGFIYLFIPKSLFEFPEMVTILEKSKQYIKYLFIV